MPLRRAASVLVAVACSLGAIAVCRAGGATAPALARGAQAYLAHCAICHGDGGAGDGPLAALLVEEGSAPPASLARRDFVRALGRAGVLAAMEGRGPHAGGGGRMPIWGPSLGRRIEGWIADWVMTLPAPRPGTPEAIDRYFESPVAAAPDGRRTYVLYCSGCHGPRGAGDGFFASALRPQLDPPDLTDPGTLAGLDDEALAATIASGGAHAEHASGMPDWIHSLEPARIGPLVRYLRALASGAPSD